MKRVLLQIVHEFRHYLLGHLIPGLMQVCMLG